MSEFWKRKIRKYFSVIDADSDGIISKNDYVGRAERFANCENADKQKADRNKAQLERIWKDYAGNKDQITPESLIDSVGKRRLDPVLAKHLKDGVHGLFHMMDANRDGFLQWEEYEKMLDQFGTSDSSFAQEAFKAIDVNGDGKLSIDEFSNAFVDFMFSEDEKSPNRFFFGTLDN